MFNLFSILADSAPRTQILLCEPEILELASYQHPDSKPLLKQQVACMKVYEAMHPKNSIEEGLNHPNQYFQASLKYYEDKEEKEGKASDKGISLLLLSCMSSEVMVLAAYSSSLFRGAMAVCPYSCASGRALLAWQFLRRARVHALFILIHLMTQVVCLLAPVCPAAKVKQEAADAA